MRGDVPAIPPVALPISVLTGFLGSGKTSFLGRALAGAGMADTAVVINEFGSVGLDHLLIEAADQEVLQLPNGCVCCAVRQDLADTLYGLLRRRARGEVSPFSRIALETSGLAEPSPILYTLSADAFLEASLRVDTVVTAVDAIAGLATLDRFSEATAQVAGADRLLLTKTDLAPPPAALLARLEALNPAARLIDAQDADPAGMLFGGDTHAIPAHRSRFSATAVHTHGITAIVVMLRQPMTRLAFAIALGGLAREHGEDLLRVKGIVAFADRPGGPAAVHAVQHTMYPPRWLDAWPDGEQTCRLVFITRNIAAAVILRAFRGGRSRRAQRRRPMMLDLAITGGVCVQPGGTAAADIGVVGDKIVSIGAPGTLAEASRTVDATGKIVIPGGVDPHIHCASPIRFPGRAEPQFTDPPAQVSRAALHGGTTTLIDFVQCTHDRSI